MRLFVNQIFHDLGDHVVFLLQLGLKFRSAALLGLCRSLVRLLESRGAVFEEFLLPASEQAGFQAMGIAVVLHGLSCQQAPSKCCLRMATLFLWREFPPNLLGHIVLHELVLTQIEENSNSD